MRDALVATLGANAGFASNNFCYIGADAARGSSGVVRIFNHS